MTTAEILSRMPGLSALVVGDICLDRWCFYDPAESEPSRETGIPRVGVVASEVTAGAGGTIANNLVAMGVPRVGVLGAVGDDGCAYELRKALAACGISAEHLVTAPSMQTFTYTKLINTDTGQEDLARVDFVTNAPLDRATEREILDRLQRAIDAYDIIFISDQAETTCGGVVTPALCDVLGDLAPNYPDKIFIADSRTRIEQYRNVIVKPNQREADTACHKLFGKVDYQALREHTRAPLLMVTQGAEGVRLVGPEGETWVHGRRVEDPVDVCGAGDSFAAGAGVALAVTKDPVAAAHFGNLVASVTIMKKGTGTALPSELLHAYASD